MLVVTAIQFCERQHGESFDVLERLDSFWHKFAKVLARDRRVGADVDNVISCVARPPKVVDSQSNYSSGDMRFPQPDLVSDQESDCRILLIEHPLERPTGGSPLEVLQVS